VTFGASLSGGVPEVFSFGAMLDIPEFFLMDGVTSYTVVFYCMYLCTIVYRIFFTCLGLRRVIAPPGGVSYIRNGICLLTLEFRRGLKAFSVANVATLRFISVTIDSHINKPIIKYLTNCIRF